MILVSVTALMCCTTLFSVYAQTLIQKLTPEGLLGKVSSAVTVICMCAFPLGQALYGFLFDGAGRAVLFGGIPFGSLLFPDFPDVTAGVEAD